MKDTEKMIKDMNKITEADYKQNHVFMWEFVINRIKDASLLLNNNLNIDIQEVKKEYLEKVKDRLEDKEFLNEKDTWLLEKINKGIQNNCWACQYVLDKLHEVYCSEACPLLVNCGGKLNISCCNFTGQGDYTLLKLALEAKDYQKALKLATEIKDAWREIK